MKIYLKHSTGILAAGTLFVIILTVICGFYFDNFYLAYVFPVSVTLTLAISLICFIIYTANKMASLLMKGCNPLGYLECINNLLNGLNLHKLIRKKEILSLVIDRATCLVYLGRYDEALEEYHFIQDNHGKMNAIFMRTAYHNLSFIAIENHDLDRAIFYYEKEKEVSEKKIVKFISGAYKNIFLSDTLGQILMEKGTFINAENEYMRVEKELQNDNMDNFYLLLTTYNMAIIKYNLKKYDEAIPRLEYVSKNGNTMACKSKADELLKELRRKNEIS